MEGRWSPRKSAEWGFSGKGGGSGGVTATTREGGGVGTGTGAGRVTCGATGAARRVGGESGKGGGKGGEGEGVTVGAGVVGTGTGAGKGGAGGMTGGVEVLICCLCGHHETGTGQTGVYEGKLFLVGKEMRNTHVVSSTGRSAVHCDNAHTNRMFMWVAEI